MVRRAILEELKFDIILLVIENELYLTSTVGLSCIVPALLHLAVLKLHCYNTELCCTYYTVTLRCIGPALLH